jgi:amino-acid N-acetyltransferase
LTTVRVVTDALGCPVQVGGEEGSPGHVTIEGVGVRAESREPRAANGESGVERRTLSAEIGEPEAVAGHSAFRNPQSAIESSPVVRKARAADVPAMQGLVAHFAARGELLPRTLNELYQHLRDFFICEVEGQIAGLCALSLYWEDLAEIRTLAVHEAHGGKGLGAALVTACLEEAAGLGVRRVFALTYRPGYFERFGFHTIDKGELPQKIWKDCIKCAKFACCDEIALIRDV